MKTENKNFYKNKYDELWNEDIHYERLLDKLEKNNAFIYEKDGFILKEKFESKETEVIYYEGNSKEIKIPDEVIRICKCAFKNNQSIRKIDLNNVKVIESSAFYNAKNLKTVIALHVEEINNSSFAFCENLENIELNGDVTLSNYCFLHCFKLNYNNYLDKKYYVDCFGDTSLFDYKFFNKNETKIKMNVDLTNIKNQTDYIKNFENILKQRTKVEIILFNDYLKETIDNILM